jgi:hypothetical protein
VCENNLPIFVVEVVLVKRSQKVFVFALQCDQIDLIGVLLVSTKVVREKDASIVKSFHGLFLKLL